jgi:hypothetical protein
MEFKITGLPMAEFAAILRLGCADLRAAGITSCVVDEPHAYPCRITLEDAMPGKKCCLAGTSARARPTIRRVLFYQAQCHYRRAYPT